MPNKAQAWMVKIKSVEREYKAIRYGIEYFLSQLTHQPELLRQEIRRPDFAIAWMKLEGTYFVRLFSEFEAALKDYHHDAGLKASGTVVHLINRIRSRLKISLVITDPVHEVRKYRNFLVHQSSDLVLPVTLREATNSLCTYLSWLQTRW